MSPFSVVEKWLSKAKARQMLSLRLIGAALFAVSCLYSLVNIPWVAFNSPNALNENFETGFFVLQALSTALFNKHSARLIHGM